MGRDGCTVCGAAFEHNARLYGGCDGYGRPVIVGDCCSEVLAQVHTPGIYAARSYDFLHPGRKSRAATDPPAHGNYQRNRDLPRLNRRCRSAARRHGARAPGVRGLGQINVLESAWKTDDRLWFERNPERSHRARSSFPGEADEQAARAPTGTVLVMLLRQVEPGKRVRAGFYINADLWPAPEIEAVAHLLFDIATGQQAQPRDAAERSALVEQYHVAGRGH